MKTCPYCKTQLPDDAAYCYQCGKQQLPESAKQVTGVCPHCNAPILNPDQAYCNSCGFPLKNQADAAPVREKVPPESEPPQADHDRPPKKTADKKIREEFAEKAALVKSGSKPKNRRVILLLAGSLAIVIMGVIGWSILRKSPSKTTQNTAVEACRPAEIPDDYEAANQKDLQGDLLRDSYFRAGEEYSIAPDATFRVPQGLTLIIQPGARVRFGEGSKFIVEGTLLACGRSSRRILFTANTEAGHPGFWSGIELNEAQKGTVIGYANVEFAGKDSHAAIWVKGSNIQLEELTFDSNQWYPISLDPNTTPSVRGQIKVENGLSEWEVRGGDLTGSRVWNYNPTLVVNGVVSILEDADLSLPANSTIKFLPQSALYVLGSLDAQGADNQKIIMTSVNDGGEEGAPRPMAGDWVGIIWSGKKSESRLSNVEIRYAGGSAANGRTYACLCLENAAIKIEFVSVKSCGTYALSTDLLSTPQIEELSIDTDDPIKRWELRESKLEDVSTYTLASLQTADGLRLDPVVTGWLGVAEKATLSIKAGAHLLFTNGNQSGLWADGILKVEGTKRDPVLMTSWRDPEVGGSGQPSAGDWGGLQLNKGKPGGTILTQLIINYAGAAENTCVRILDSSPRLENVQINHCSGYPLSSNAQSEPAIENLGLAENSMGDVWEIRGSDFTDRRTYTWAPVSLADGQLLIRRITGKILVDTEATLALDPGLSLAFGQEGYLVIRGGIQSSGTPDAPILLSSWRDASINTIEGGAQPGDWPGLILDGEREGQVLKNLLIHYAGNTNQKVSCLLLNNASPLVDNVEISDCSYYPISSDLNSNPSIGEISLTNNQLGNAWVVRESTLSSGSTQKWMPINQAGGEVDLPRVITGRLTIDNGAKLELGPGVVLRFNQSAGMLVHGSLSIAASQQSPTILTSWRDPEYSTETGVQAGDWAGIFIDNPQGSVNLDWLEMRYAGDNGGVLKLNNATSNLTNVLIRDSSSYPISMDVQSNLEWGQVTLIDNYPADVIEVRGSNLERAGEQTWNPLKLANGAEVVRLVTDMLTIQENATLHLKPQVVVKFTASGGMEIRGGLSAQNAVFTSFHDDEYGGNSDSVSSGELIWKGIRLLTQKSVALQDFTLRYAEIGFWMENSSPNLSNVSIEYCSQAAMSADFLSTPRLENVALTGSAINGLLLRGSVLPDGETHWNRLGDTDQVVRILVDSLSVSPRSQLIIDEGVVLKLGSQVGLVIEGQLSIVGNEESPVILTSLSDDDAGGDTDSIQSAPNRGAWVGLVINPNNTGARLSLTFAEIRYAANGLYLVNMPEWTYNNLLISNSLYYGISCDQLSAYAILEDNIRFVNNGNESVSCPSPDR